MSRITIHEKIAVEPSALNSNIRNHLFNKIVSTFSNKCDKEYGYILKVYDDIRIISNVVSSASSDIFFDVTFPAKVLKPEIGKEYTGKVFMIFQHGILIEVHDRMKILIPADKLKDFTYNKKNVFKNNTDTIQINSVVTCVIDRMQYEKNNFSCIGNLKTLSN
jgi:DNA-directed RNA polymerase subunit E'/Rpb7